MADGIDVRVDLSELKSVIREQPEKWRQVGDVAAQSITDDIKRSFGQSPPGRRYERRSVVHIASQPGYPPNVDTGALRASMRWERRGDDRIIQDGVEYGIYLEQVHNRPFVSPVFEDYGAGKLAMIVRQILGLT